VLATSGQIASVAEKARLFASYGASAVDMEAAAVGRLARAHELDFVAIKTISDEAAFELPELGRFATSDGQFREAAFGLYAAVHPPIWGKVMRLAKNSKLAIDALTRAVEDELHRGR
jgi:adenosylhomocysteine nucleosidase